MPPPGPAYWGDLLPQGTLGEFADVKAEERLVVREARAVRLEAEEALGAVALGASLAAASDHAFDAEVEARRAQDVDIGEEEAIAAAALHAVRARGALLRAEDVGKVVQDFTLRIRCRSDVDAPLRRDPVLDASAERVCSVERKFRQDVDADPDEVVRAIAVAGPDPRAGVPLPVPVPVPSPLPAAPPPAVGGPPPRGGNATPLGAGPSALPPLPPWSAAGQAPAVAASAAPAQPLLPLVAALGAVGALGLWAWERAARRNR